MVDVSYSPRESIENGNGGVLEETIPEDNVERLRNIRDMFENSTNDSTDELVLKKVEKLQPADKIKDRFKKFEEGVLDSHEDEEDDDAEDQDGKIVKSKTKKKDFIQFAELSNVKNKFENIANEANESSSQQPKPVRSITPPPDGANRVEIENQPMERSADIVSVYEKMEDALPSAGYTRSRKEIFASAGQKSRDDDQAKQMPPRVKSITPPREEVQKRVLKEKTPERNENVIRESDRIEDVMPSVGSIKQTAAAFANPNSRVKSIERSNIIIEGELTEKGIAKSRLALFSDPNAVVAQQSSTISTTELESEIMKNASGIAKERLSLFKNLEQPRNSPPKEVKKLKEFTPPPQLDPAHQQQRQYIIIDKDNNSSSISSADATDGNSASSQKYEEFVPESGLAKNRMKQYLETASSSSTAGNTSGDTQELSSKGVTRNLLAKWKSIENVKDREGSANGDEESSENNRDRQMSPQSGEEFMPQAGLAKSLKNKFQNIESSPASSKERKGPRAITPPPIEEIERQKLLNQEEDSPSVKPVYDEELAMIGKGLAKNALAKFEQSVMEASTKVKKSVTPPKEFIKQVATTSAQSVYESSPVESGINAQFAEEEIIPAAGNAKQLKNMFLNFEKEAAKVETSSSKMNYIPKKFTSSSTTTTTTTTTTTPTSNGDLKGKPAPQPNGHSPNSTGEKCCVCEKTVYAMEKIEADKKIYHKTCFKCTSCNCPLNEDNCEFDSNKPYCAVDFKKLLKTKTPPASPAKKQQPTPASPAKSSSTNNNTSTATTTTIVTTTTTTASSASPKHKPTVAPAAQQQTTITSSSAAGTVTSSTSINLASPKKDPQPPKSPSKTISVNTSSNETKKSSELAPSPKKSQPNVQPKSPVKAK